jgi:hypothetical protein
MLGLINQQYSIKECDTAYGIVTYPNEPYT